MRHLSGICSQWEEMAFENTSIARHLLSAGQRKYCFHYDRFTGQVTGDNVLSYNSAHLSSKKWDRKYIVNRKCCFQYDRFTSQVT